MSLKSLVMLMAATLVGPTWAADQPLPGTKLLVKQTTTSSASYASKSLGLVGPVPAGADDPSTRPGRASSS